MSCLEWQVVDEVWSVNSAEAQIVINTIPRLIWDRNLDQGDLMWAATHGKCTLCLSLFSEYEAGLSWGVARDQENLMILREKPSKMCTPGWWLRNALCSFRPRVTSLYQAAEMNIRICASSSSSSSLLHFLLLLLLFLLQLLSFVLPTH